MLVSTRNSVADVYAFKMFNDNYGYFLVDRKSGQALTVDPGDGAAVSEVKESNGINLQAVLCTHKHSDHVGGNELLKEKYPFLKFIATKYEPIPCATELVGDSQKFQFGSLSITAHNTFCHTAGHISYFIDDESNPDPNRDPILFSGDTLFVGGCGRFFEGNAQQMLQNMDLYATLPGNTQVFCAHEYTEGNYKFLNSVDTNTCGRKFAEIQQIRAEGRPTIPSSISEELKYNLFMKCRDPSLQQILGVSTAVDAMHELRTRKNNF